MGLGEQGKNVTDEKQLGRGQKTGTNESIADKESKRM